MVKLWSMVVEHTLQMYETEIRFICKITFEDIYIQIYFFFKKKKKKTIYELLRHLICIMSFQTNWDLNDPQTPNGIACRYLNLIYDVSQKTST